jgi:hypothetical protein
MTPRLLEGVQRQAIGLRIMKKALRVCCSLSSLSRNMQWALISSSFHTIYKSTSVQEMRISVSCGLCLREGVIIVAGYEPARDATISTTIRATLMHPALLENSMRLSHPLYCT